MNDSLNFCLTFENGLAGLITAFSRRLSLDLATDYVLSPEAMPHVTVLKVNKPSLHAAEIWQKLLPSLPQRLSLRFEGLRMLPSKGGDVWMEISVARSAELQLLQEMASRHLHDYGIRGGVGDLWRPHVTLLHSVDGRLPKDINLEKSLLMAEDVIATPSLGKDIPPGIMTDILHRPDL